MDSKLLISALVATFLAIPHVSFANDDVADLYFSTSKSKALSKKEKESLKLVEQWNQNAESRPAIGSDGAVQFTFGASQPTILCAVLQITDVKLQPGEQVNTIHLGDSARWSIEPAITGYGSQEVQHLIIKPKDVGLETSLLVTTNRRTYHMRLKSHRSQYLPHVSFIYPEEVMAKWDAIKINREERIRHNTIESTGEYLGNLDFSYTIAGKARWKPVRVYNDGTKTIIEMPAGMKQTEAPTLLVVRKEGGLVSEDEVEMVNYRLQDRRYIVDSLFERAILIAGVGNSQEKITITKGN